MMDPEFRPTNTFDIMCTLGVFTLQQTMWRIHFLSQQQRHQPLENLPSTHPPFSEK